MKIIKYTKIKNNLYELTLDNNTKVIYHEEIILKHNLLLTKELNEKQIVKLNIENDKYVGYDLALKYLSTRIRSKEEIKKHLTNKEIDYDVINFIIDKLIKDNYINDEMFVRAFVNDKFNLTSDGPYKVLKALDKHNKDNDLTYIIFDVFTKDEQIKRINNIVNKYMARSVINTSIAPRKRLENNLINSGYEKTLVYSFLNDYEFDDEELKKKEYEKLHKRYSKKHEGAKLELLIKQKLYQKGYK